MTKPKWIKHKKEDFKIRYEKVGGSYGCLDGFPEEIDITYYYSEKLNIYITKRENDYRSFNGGENYWGYLGEDGNEYCVEWI